MLYNYLRTSHIGNKLLCEEVASDSPVSSAIDNKQVSHDLGLILTAKVSINPISNA